MKTDKVIKILFLISFVTANGLLGLLMGMPRPIRQVTDVKLPGPVQGPIMPIKVPPPEQTTVYTYDNLYKFKNVDVDTLNLLNKEIERLSQESGVSAHLIKAVIAIESGYDTEARSNRGAVGLMQLMPGTAKFLKVNPNIASENLKGGVAYLKYLKKLFHNDEVLIIAAYNAGEGNVIKYNGIPPFEETQKYVKRVLIAKNLIIKDEQLTIKQASV